MKLAAVVAAVLVVCGLLQLFFGTTPAGAPWGDYYKQSTLSGVGGGFLGGILTSFLVVGLGKPGTFPVSYTHLDTQDAQCPGHGCHRP